MFFSNSVLSGVATQCMFVVGCSENKNNTNLAWASMLVAKGWKDVIDFMFGPVGHTHNRIDAWHKIHNQDVGQYYSATLGVRKCLFAQF